MAALWEEMWNVNLAHLLPPSSRAREDDEGDLGRIMAWKLTVTEEDEAAVHPGLDLIYSEGTFRRLSLSGLNLEFSANGILYSITCPFFSVENSMSTISFRFGLDMSPSVVPVIHGFQLEFDIWLSYWHRCSSTCHVQNLLTALFSSQVSFISIVRCAVQIVLKQLHRENNRNCSDSDVKQL